ncbi:MAG: hypothetical protein CVU62_11445 [Deltaproteobacteria bacterium HGW-Deltaproteobacteria-2]|jgi:hypothetical protein|nr:MAG: hypothetical protein CVU62_11445 [Deltaproteobacteria bacterium HGW-Deltaproteobacteria-2]
MFGLVPVSSTKVFSFNGRPAGDIGDILQMADAVHVPPKERLLNIPFEWFAVSASVLIPGGILSYEK